MKKILIIISFLFTGGLLSAQQTLQVDQSPGTGVTVEDYKKCTDDCAAKFPGNSTELKTCIEGCRFLSRTTTKAAGLEAPKPLNTAPTTTTPTTTTPTTTTPTKTTTKKQ